MNGGGKYRILSLDGGGSWALLQARALIDIYGSDATAGHDVLKDFDLVAANSGGSIVLGELLKNSTLGEIRDFFLSLHERQSIFVTPAPMSTGDWIIEKIAKVGPKYDADKKLLGLRAALAAEDGSSGVGA
jgi:hypothetical protein